MKYLKEFFEGCKSAFNLFDVDFKAKAYADCFIITTPEDNLVLKNSLNLKLSSGEQYPVQKNWR
jgi:hypothetical protein